jgi:hypothetical protein
MLVLFVITSHNPDLFQAKMKAFPRYEQAVGAFAFQAIYMAEV